MSQKYLFSHLHLTKNVPSRNGMVIAVLTEFTSWYTRYLSVVRDGCTLQKVSEDLKVQKFTAAVLVMESKHSFINHAKLKKLTA